MTSKAKISKALIRKGYTEAAKRCGKQPVCSEYSIENNLKHFNIDNDKPGIYK